jgi:hypothetical protein
MNCINMRNLITSSPLKQSTMTSTGNRQIERPKQNNNNEPLTWHTSTKCNDDTADLLIVHQGLISTTANPLVTPWRQDDTTDRTVMCERDQLIYRARSAPYPTTHWSKNTATAEKCNNCGRHARRITMRSSTTSRVCNKQHIRNNWRLR